MKEPRTPEEVWEAAKLAADQGHDPDGIAPIAAYGELCRRAPDADRAALLGLVRELRDALQGMCDAEDIKDYLVLAGALEWAHITITRADAALAGEKEER